MKKKKKKKIFSNLIWFWTVLFKIAPVNLFAVTIIPLITGIGSAIISWYYSKIIDILIGAYSNSITFTELISWDSEFMVKFIPYILLLTVNSLLYITMNYCDRKIKDVKMNEFSYRIHKKLGELEYHYYYDKDVSNLIRKVLDNYRKVYRYYGSVGVIITSFFNIIISIAILAKISPILLGVAIVLNLPHALNQIFYTREKFNFYTDNIERDRQSGWLRGYLRSHQNIAAHNINKANEYLFSKMKKITNEYSEEEFAIEKKHVIRRVFFAFLRSIKFAGSVMYLIYMLLKKKITVGRMGFLWGRVHHLSSDMTKIIGAATGLIEIQFIMGLLQEFFALKTEIKSGDKKLKKDSGISIRFENVGFKYPRTDKLVLKDINMEIKEGEEIAIVGANGAGKTTLIKLILRFYEPTNGQIYINDIPVENMDLESYYDKITVLFQEFCTYNSLTVKENVCLSDWTKELEEKRLNKALKESDAFSFVQKLDNKKNQILSGSFSEGTELSWGQWQKLALARVFYREGDLLILDEPTSAIDAKAEYEIFKRIYEYIEDKTVVIISHRFSTVRNAERIYVLDDGSIIESGSHDELLALNGLYAESYQLQAEGYE